MAEGHGPPHDGGMRSRIRRTLHGLLVIGVALVAVAALLSVSTSTATATVGRDREGNCRAGPGEWDLQVKRRPHRRLRVRFEVDEVGRRQRWQVFMNANGHRIASVTRRSGRDADFQVTRRTRNTRGRDRVSVAAVNPRTGSVCRARMRVRI
jgi:hypothetical protein